jgi:hypothetical protein
MFHLGSASFLISFLNVGASEGQHGTKSAIKLEQQDDDDEPHSKSRSRRKKAGNASAGGDVK